MTLKIASLQNPANIPVVLASSCTLYQTQKRSCKSGRYPGCDVEREYLQKSNLDLQCNYEKADQVFLPLGMVVNAVFKNKGWLYVQTPHGEEGYVSARACLPLGILPPPAPRTSPEIPLLRKDPFWGHSLISPPNKTDNEKLRDTVSEGGGMRLKNQRRRRGGCRVNHHIRPEEAAVDRLYLKATAASSVASTSGGRNRGRWGYGDQRETLLLIRSDYHSTGCDTISVDKGDVVALVNHPLENWFWVRAHDGTEGLIPSAVAGYGYF
ncbi:hypothetical protein J437_LFUL003762 [Ladona fulva]|uniref:SH3 domain-containing protein n=1 Tax=Ladona fulva TaxID=123851 RepID=A0A8K0NXZ9_LADFU|nr:hypothetical protein J437_LFUL003762 [Ladona fulva]